VTNRKKIDMEERLLWDLLPEEFPYEDKGCELFPSCLNCPFPDCLEEQPWGKERFLKRRRAERMLELRQEGKSIKEIARIFEVSPRTVQRWLKAVKEALPPVIARSASDEAISDGG
jgi:DNA-binding transcriptional ArsR family regulator